nr:glycosyltransferase family A protein [uncultured Pedobacter sp.]
MSCKISFCTVSMNRVNHIEKTLLANIKNSTEYNSVEFILLDYNSKDSLEQFVKDNLYGYIESKTLKYFKTFRPRFFERSHSRNLAFRLAKGEILCNVDADNYIGNKFPEYINETFQKNKNIFMTTIDKDQTWRQRDVLGRICVKRSDFYKIHGYDEDISSYGFEDHDLVERLELSGLSRTFIIDERFLGAIKHSNLERVCYESLYQSLNLLLISYHSTFLTELLFLLRDESYVSIVFNRHGKIMRSENGGLKMKGNHINLLPTAGESRGLAFLKKKNLYLENLNHRSFFVINDHIAIQNAVLFYNQMHNRIIIEHNKKKAKVVNEFGFGNDVVFKNFDYNNPIYL